MCSGGVAERTQPAAKAVGGFLSVSGQLARQLNAAGMQELGDYDTVTFEEGILDANLPINTPVHPSAIFWRIRLIPIPAMRYPIATEATPASSPTVCPELRRAA